MKRPITYSFLLSTAMAITAFQSVQAQETPEETTETTTEDGDARTLETVTVRGRFIPEPQRQTSQVASFLSNEDLQRQGDANAALALTRLSGLSVVSGKFAFVRGLGDRYSAALLNGSPLPSPEPLRRTVPLDLFPSSVLDGAAVQKTFSANYPAEFGGGLIDLKTIKQPIENYLNVKIGVGYNTESTNDIGLLVEGSDLDWLGYDDGLRDVPGPLNAVFGSNQSLNGLDPAQIEVIGESLVNTPLSVIQTEDLGPGSEVAVDLGYTFSQGQYDFGFVGVAGYNQDLTTERALRQFAQGGRIGREFNTVETTVDTTINALGSGSVGWDTNEITGTLFYVHITSNEAQTQEGNDFNAPGTGNVFNESTGWFERELIFFQLAGDHEFGNLDLSWRGSISESSRDAPYERSLSREIVDDGRILYRPGSGAYAIRFSDLTDQNNAFGGDADYLISFEDGRELTLSGGFDYSNTEREYNFRSLRFVGGNSLTEEIRELRPDFLFSPDNIDPARFRLQESSSVNDNYEAELEVTAAYAQADFDLTNFIQATLGARYEEGTQTVQTFDRFGNAGGAPVLIEEEYLLPAATFTWNFADDLQLRLGYSETIARPQFRELARSLYFDPENDRSYRGNDQLVDTEITNFDARLEYYMGLNQFVNAAAFYKELENPIEEYRSSPSDFVFETSFINSPKAELYGIELEYRNRFEMPLEGQFFADRDWLFSANYTYTSSEIIVDDGDVIFEPILGTNLSATSFDIDGAQLQGTPENILNVQFGWESDVDQLTLLLGWVDERILQRGRAGGVLDLPDVVEDPGVQLDLVYRRTFEVRDHEVTLGLSARNILNEDHVEFQDSGGDIGKTDFNTYARGTSLSASLTAKF